MKITVDMKNLKRLDRQLRTFKKRAYPFATKETLNSTAFEARAIATKRIQNSLILRNRFVLQSIRVDKTKTLDISKQMSIIGSTAEAMEVQEFGGTKIKKGKHGVAIPTSFSAGQAEDSRPRLSLPKPAVRLNRLKGSGKSKRRPGAQPKTNRQALLFKIQDAVQSGNRIFFHKFPGQKTTGIYRVKGGRKGFKRGSPKGAKLKLLYSLDEKSVRIPRKPWLKPTTEVAQKRMPAIHLKSVIFQLKRHNIFQG